MDSTFSPGAEWLEADGLGGFASGTVSGLRTRRYHALLLTATTPPTGRMVLVNGFEAWVTTPAGSFPLTSQHYAPDVVHPDGANRIERFAYEPWPCWEFRLEDGTRLCQELFVPHGRPAICLAWRLLDDRPHVHLSLRPFLSGRGYHATHHENGAFRFDAEARGERLIWYPYVGPPAIVSASNGAYTPRPEWYRNFHYRDEQARGLECTEDLASPGVYEWDLSTAEALWVLAARPHDLPDPLPDEPVQTLVKTWRAAEKRRREAFPSALHRAADTYLVTRGAGQTIVAGYPWFTDWGRDTFISLRGLCLASGRLDDARDILVQWANAVSQGMLPNLFTDSGETPEFNSADASLWYVIAVHEYLAASQLRRGKAAAADRATLRHAVEAILEGYTKGTRFGIRCDTDGLLAAGVPGVQLTWMDAKVGDWVVTPRIGKPVELQALWLNALRIGTEISDRWDTPCRHGLESFTARFWNERRGCLYDVIDVDHESGKTDAALRPNQIFAIGGLPFPILDGERARAVVDVVEATLLTPIGLRSLAPDEAGYCPRYEGGVRERDSAYHQGTVWPWLLGPFIEAWVRVRGNTSEAKAEAGARFLDPLMRHLDDAGLGHVSEIADADPPHTPRGCPFQAWSVGEALRTAHVVLAKRPNARNSTTCTEDSKMKKRRPTHARG